MPDFKASSGPCDVVASGTVIAFQGNPIEVTFDALVEPLNLTPDPPSSPQFEQRPVTFPAMRGARFKLNFQFTDEPTPGEGPVPTARIHIGGVPDQLTINFTMFNFTSPLGSGNTKPIPFGYAGDRTLYLQYRVFALRDGDKTLHFTIFQSRMVDRPRVEASSPTPEKGANG
jgi:hypothetical protein